MSNPILIFEQDVLDVVKKRNAILNEQFVKDYLNYLVDEDYPEVDLCKEHEDDNVVVYQGFNSEGESWKFIQVKG